ncbi:MAG: hypothetical protein JWN62_682 [Acidimicrobiales bacterium]|nr:hypothetical protein [Acidimicrobiales bacterium]
MVGAVAGADDAGDTVADVGEVGADVANVSGEERGVVASEDATVIAVVDVATLGDVVVVAELPHAVAITPIEIPIARLIRRRIMQSFPPAGRTGHPATDQTARQLTYPTRSANSFLAAVAGASPERVERPIGQRRDVRFQVTRRAAIDAESSVRSALGLRPLAG